MKPTTKTELDKLLQQCLKNDRRAQKKLYEKFGPVMMMVCRRYLFDRSKAEEVMNQGFFNVFTKLSSYKSDGSFEGWVRRIMVNESLNENRRRRVHYSIEEKEETEFLESAPEADEKADTEYILRIIAALPMGYRTIFNMMEVEGYSNEEVSEKLGIDKGTVRSQLSRAKQLLRKKLRSIKGL